MVARIARGSSALLFILTAASPAFAEDPVPPYLAVHGRSAVVPVDKAVGDLLVVDGSVEIRGVVRGHVYAVDAEVVVRSSAVVLKSITLTRGALHLSEGAVLPSAVDLYAAKLFGPRGESANASKPVEVAGGGTLVTLRSTEVSTVSVSLMKSVLPFERFAPPDSMNVEALRGWHPGLGLETKRFIENPDALSIGGITKLTFVSNQVRGAFQRGYEGPRGNVRFTGIQLTDRASAKALWDSIHAAGKPAKVRVSIETALGDGAHWFFEKRRRHVMLWQRGSWVFAVETRLDAKKGTLFQEKQFLDQVLRSLALDLGSRTNLEEGARR